MDIRHVCGEEGVALSDLSLALSELVLTAFQKQFLSGDKHQSERFTALLNLNQTTKYI